MTRASKTMLAISLGAIIGGTFCAVREASASHRFLPGNACSPTFNASIVGGVLASEYSGRGFTPDGYCPFVQEGIFTQTNDLWTFNDNQIKNIWVQVNNVSGQQILVKACTATANGGNCGNGTASSKVGLQTLNISSGNLSPWTNDKNAQLMPYVDIAFQATVGDQVLGVSYNTF